MLIGFLIGFSVVSFALAVYWIIRYYDIKDTNDILMERNARIADAYQRTLAEEREAKLEVLRMDEKYNQVRKELSDLKGDNRAKLPQDN